MKQARYLPITWASNIGVQRWGENLHATGKLPLSDSDIEGSGDPYLQYVSSVKSQFAQKRTGKNSPHIRFANALDDEKLVAFVREFGPVASSEVSITEPTDRENMTLDEQWSTDWHSTITAIQPLDTLRTEQRTYAATLRLMLELKPGKGKARTDAILQHVSTIEDGVQNWPDQYEAERVWRNKHYFGSAAWYFDKNSRDFFSKSKYELEWWLKIEQTPAPERASYPDSESYETACFMHVFHPRPKPHYLGHEVLCRLFNTFRTEVQHSVDDRPLEALSLFSLRFGVRPALYVILKNDYLGRGGAMICGNDRCGQFFVSERTGQVYCSDDCSRHYRQRQYWNRTGGKRRKALRAKLKSKRKAVRRL